MIIKPSKYQKHLYIKTVPKKGRGVFTSVEIPNSTIFLIDPIIYVDRNECRNYIYESNEGKTFVDLGIGSLINHASNEPEENAWWFFDKKKRVIIFESLRLIKPNEEISHNYAYDSYSWETE